MLSATLVSAEIYSLVCFIGQKGLAGPLGSGMFQDTITSKLSGKDRFSKKGRANILRRCP